MTSASFSPVMPSRANFLQRKCACGSSAGLTGQCAECDEERFSLQRQVAGQRAPAATPPIVNQVLRSPGQSLDSNIRAFMESRFGHDFSQVRVHADSRASDSARAVGAMAYTVGKDVVFQTGHYSPQTDAGRRLLAHELTHVVQQSGDAAGQQSGDAAGQQSGDAAGQQSGDAAGQQSGDVAGRIQNHPSSGLAISQPGDRAEQEADRAAEAVAAGGSFAPSVKAASGAAGATIHRADEEWNKAYGTHKSFLQKPFDEFKAGLGEIKSTTEGGLTENKGRPLTQRPKGAPTGTPAAPEISFDVLKEIYSGLKADVTADPDKEKKAQKYLEHLNKAFKIMKIDTVEAQAVYLAHAFIESDQFRQFTETQGSINQGAQKWMDDPTKVQLNTTDLAGRYAKGGTVNPGGNFEFIGRGPVQVTHKAEYVEVIAMLEKAADQYQKEANAGDVKAKEYAELARKAAKDIKADPRKAADPEYTFLVSAAFMKKRGADVSAATVKTNTPWTGADAASGWVAGGKQKAGSPQAQALIDKSNAYDKIYPVLLREANKKKPSAQTATP
jgi:predicted chitinase